jgi:anti-sigma-K factor RskA
MSAHEQFAEDLALHALGALRGDERAALEKHLDACPACRQELEQLSGDMALLAMSTTGPKPPQRARQRLLEAIAKEPRVPSTAGPARASRFNWWAAFGWAAAVAMLLVVIHLRRENYFLHESVNTLASLTGQQTVELANAQRVVDTLTAPESQAVTLVASKNPPQPQGKAFYLRNRSGLVFVANNLAPLPPDKIYELWLFPPTGAPIPAGLFKPDAKGNATVVNPPGLPAGVEAKAFAVTLEPASGPHDAPRGTGVMAGGA